MDHGINVAKVSISNISLSVRSAAGRGQGHSAIYPHLGPDCSSQHTHTHSNGVTFAGEREEGRERGGKLQRDIRMSSKACVKPYQGLEAAGGFCLAGAAGIQEDPGGQDMPVLRGSLIARGDLTRPRFSHSAPGPTSPLRHN